MVGTGLNLRGLWFHEVRVPYPNSSSHGVLGLYVHGLSHRPIGGKMRRSPLMNLSTRQVLGE